MLPIWVLALLLGTVVGKEVCFQRLGCFSDDAPWAGTLKRPLKVLPWSPKEVNTRFLLYTNENPNTFQELVADQSTIEASNFKTDRKTRFIIHGFLDKGEGGWPADICKNMFQVESVNCICVDWSSGSHTTYSQATQNTRIVGAEVAYFVEVLQTAFEYAPSSVHIIGHSLGAHTAGEAGRRTNGTVGRITGLDPAQPYFEGTPELVRLDASDAQFVDVIHTDTAPTIPNMGFGTSQISGHLDFFPNGGVHMPGCQRNVFSELVDIQGIWEGVSNFIACNHLRSFQYYADSILHPEGFAGFPCASYKTFTENKCFPCPSEGCPQMGHYADRFPGKTKEVGQTFYLNTGDTAGSFSRWRYKVTVTLSGQKARGHVLVSLFGDRGNSKQCEVFSGALQPASIHSSDIDSDVDVGDLQTVKFAWHKIINLTHPEVGASQITVERNDGKTYKFCSQSSVKEGVLLTLTPC